SIFSESTSVPITSCPMLAKVTQVTKPTWPVPITTTFKATPSVEVSLCGARSVADRRGHYVAYAYRRIQTDAWGTRSPVRGGRSSRRSCRGPNPSQVRADRGGHANHG